MNPKARVGVLALLVAISFARGASADLLVREFPELRDEPALSKPVAPAAAPAPAPAAVLRAPPDRSADSTALLVGSGLVATGGVTVAFGGLMAWGLSGIGTGGFDLVGGHCQDGGQAEQDACSARRGAEQRSRADDAGKTKRTAQRLVAAGSAAAVVGTLAFVILSQRPKNDVVTQAVRVALVGATF